MTPQEWDVEHDLRRERLYACGMNWLDAEIRACLEIESEHGERPKEAA